MNKYKVALGCSVLVCAGLSGALLYQSFYQKQGMGSSVVVQVAPEHSHLGEGDPAAIFPEKPIVAKVSHIESFEKKYQQELALLKDNPEFMGQDVDTLPAKAPESTYLDVDGFRVKVPELSEEQIEANVYSEQLSYTLGNLRPELLDGMMSEYQHQYSTLMTEVGLARDCSGPYCGVRVNQGAFLQALHQSGFQAGDLIVTVNSVDVNSIENYDQFKQVLFAHANTLEMNVVRNGEVQGLQVPVKLAAQMMDQS